MDKPLKVAHLCMVHYGGAGTAAYRLHRGLLDMGVESSMFVMLKRSNKPGLHLLPSLSGPAYRSAEDPRVIISPAWDQAQTQWHKRLQSYPKRPEGLECFSSFDGGTDISGTKEIREADIVNLHWVAGMINIRSELEFLKSKRIIWTLHDMNPFTGGCHYSLGCEGYISSCGKCPQLGSSSANDLSQVQWRQRNDVYSQLQIEVVSPSTWLAGLARRSSLFSRFPVRVIPNGLPTDVFQPMDKMKLRRKLGLPCDRPIILFGAIDVTNKRKGFSFLLQALARLKDNSQAKDLLLAVCGRGMERFQSSIPFPVLEFGYIQEEERMALVYSLADAFIVPSQMDNLPNVVMESLSCGTPVVGFCTGGIPDMVDHGRTGYLSEPEDVGSLADGIIWACDEKNRKRQIHLVCRSVALERYVMSNQAREYRQLYERIVSNEVAA